MRCACSSAISPIPDVAYVCGRHFYEQAEGTNREWFYARFEGWLRRNESRIGSITGGVGPIYAVRRDDYLELDPRLGHDVVFPYLLAQRGRRSIVDPEAVAWEKPARDVADEYGRKLRMFEHSWLILFRGSMLRRQRPCTWSRLSRTGTCAMRAGRYTSSCSPHRRGSSEAARSTGALSRRKSHFSSLRCDRGSRATTSL